MSAAKRKPALPSKPPSSKVDKPLPLPVPAEREPGIITSFMNMVDLAEALEAEDLKKRKQ
jgi:hypothetical protein